MIRVIPFGSIEVTFSLYACIFCVVVTFLDALTFILALLDDPILKEALCDEAKLSVNDGWWLSALRG